MQQINSDLFFAPDFPLNSKTTLSFPSNFVDSFFKVTLPEGGTLSLLSSAPAGGVDYSMSSGVSIRDAWGNYVNNGFGFNQDAGVSAPLTAGVYYVTAYAYDANLPLLDFSVSFATGSNPITTLSTISAPVSSVISSNIKQVPAMSANAIFEYGESDLTFDADLRDNVIFGNSGYNKINGGAGNDYIDTGAGVDTIDGGAGDDVIMAINNGGFGIIAKGGLGNDTIWARSGDDIIDGGEGNDSIDGGSGSDKVDGGKGDDIIEVGYGHDTITGGDGNDTVIDAGGIGNIKTGSGDDIITANGFNNKIDSGDGNDVITASDDRNTITAGKGNDSITSGSGKDKIDAGDGNDVINAGNGINTVLAGKGDDSITSGSNDDSIDGADGVDVIFSGSGADKITGGKDGDIIDGGAGNDMINGGAGLDKIIAGLGNDTLTGGSDSDTFVLSLSGLDTVTDFKTGVDKLVFGDAETLVSLDSSHFVSSANSVFSFTAADSYGYNTKTGALFHDVDGAGGVDQVQIALIADKSVVVFSDILI